MTGASSASFDNPAFFVHRPWIESQLEGWLASDTANSVAVLTGSPGTGKSRYAYWLSKRLPAFNHRAEGAALGAVVLRDRGIGRSPDDFSWPVLRDSLLSLANRAAVRRITIRAPRRQRFGDVHGIAVGQLNVLGGTKPESELRDLVLPALEQLPEGGPVIVIIDGLDETGLFRAGEFLEAVNVLALRIAESAGERRGLGRLRMLLTSQPETPLPLSSLRPLCIDLSKPGAGDGDALQAHAYALLDPLDPDSRRRIAESIAEQAGSIWMLGWYAAHAINIDVSDGRPVPATVKLPPDLATWYKETITRIAARDEGTWPDAERVLAHVAAAQEVGVIMPTDVSRAELRVRDGEFRQILRCARALLTGEHDELQFFHGHFGRWIIDGGLGATAVAEAHDVLAQVLIDLTDGDWRTASKYAQATVQSMHCARLSTGWRGLTSRGCETAALTCSATMIGWPRIPGRVAGSATSTGWPTCAGSALACRGPLSGLRGSQTV